MCHPCHFENKSILGGRGGGGGGGGGGANSADPDNMAHYELPHLNLHCLLIQLLSFLVLAFSLHFLPFLDIGNL